MGKPLKAFRFPTDVYNQFKKVTSRAGYTATGAFTRFMEICVHRDELVFPETAGDHEAEARILLSWLRNNQYWYISEKRKH